MNAIRIKRLLFFVAILILFIERSILKTGNQIRRTPDAFLRKGHGWIKFLRNWGAQTHSGQSTKMPKNTPGGQTEAMLIIIMLGGGLIIRYTISFFLKHQSEHWSIRKSVSQITRL